MAKIGLKDLYYGALTEASDGTPSYADGAKIAKIVSSSVNITLSDVKLYADDALAESDASFQSGTISVVVDDDDDTVMAALLGHTITSGEMVRNANDVAPWVGVGRIITKMVGGTKKYKVEFLNKVQFHEPNQENTTKGEAVEFATHTLEGTVATLANGDWSKTETFTTYAAAKTYLEGLF